VKILIVDDQPTNLKLLQAQLQAAGHAVIPALDGVQALDVLRQQSVDAIISDILMPRMDGYRLCYELRKNPEWQATPFIFYTATYTSVADEKLSLELGGDKYLLKPCRVEEMLAALAEVTSDGGRQRRRLTASLSVPDVMQQYNQRLVSKLEEKNVELHEAMQELETANKQVLALNRTLERRVAERTAELEATNKELEAFSYSVSHDLRSPLRSIDGFLQLFREEYARRLPEGADEKLAYIRQHAVHMGRLIEGLLAFSRSARAPLKKERVSPAVIVRQVLDELCPGREERNVQVSVGDLPECEADATLLRQVFVNLLSNAIKYSRQRAPAVIEVGCCDEQGESVFFVRDNGAGFAMDDAKRLFGVFERLHDSAEFEGIGVGLSIVKRIVERHGGRVWAESVPNEGATFRFTLGTSRAARP
jgi:two-component system, sensor histidine kinase and response regulator